MIEEFIYNLFSYYIKLNLFIQIIISIIGYYIIFRIITFYRGIRNVD